MENREIKRMIKFLNKSKKAQDLFTEGSVEIRYNPIMDEIHFISLFSDEVVTCKV